MKRPANRNAPPNTKPAADDGTQAAPEQKRQRHEKPSAVAMYEKKKGRNWTLSVALPSSIVANAQSHELRSYLVAQIARYLTIYGVDEVVLYEDQQELVNQGSGEADSWTEQGGNWEDSSWNNTAASAKQDTNSTATTPAAEQQNFSWALNFFARNLQYLETPQYLRKILFGMHSDLKFAGVQNPLDAPHHLRKGEKIAYREGVILEERHFPYEKPCAEGVFVCCGLDEPVWIADGLGAEAGMRVTVALGEDVLGGTAEEAGVSGGAGRKISEIVSPSVPREADGLYWGYQTRCCKDLQSVFSEPPSFAEVQENCGAISNPGQSISKRRLKLNLSFDPFKHYDLVLGTSERGRDIGAEFSTKKKLAFKHCLVLFGGLGGLEAAMKDEIFVGKELAWQKQNPEKLVQQEKKWGRNNEGGKVEMNKKDASKNYVNGNPRTLCHHYLNVCPNQTSRTIRAEEALLISLATLDRYLDK
eukprot:g4281.t1